MVAKKPTYKYMEGNNNSLRNNILMRGKYSI